MKKKMIVFLLVLFPIQVFAYSNKIIVSGKPIGIEIHSNGVYVIDFYKVQNEFIAKKAGLKKGDRIVKVNQKEIENLESLRKELQEEKEYKLTIDRDGKVETISLKPLEENNQIKLGFYGKDVINGIGTLSYIDPETKIYASLGHEILESSSNQKFDCKNGYIYDVELNYINKSENGRIGEVHANFKSNIEGNIEKNEINGIYGKYTESIQNFESIEVANKNEIKKGKASIRIQMDNAIKDYEINILTISEQDPVKNIYFEIKDEELMNKTGGIVQGMSGSPIIQNNKIIGVVNYVVVNDSKKGYGIFIEKMLEEGDKLLQE